MKKIIALAIVLVAFSQVSYADKIFIRKNNSTADSTPRAKTYSTIDSGMARISNGDTLIIYEGTYPDRINFNQSGVI
ncbi:MAG: hypothetical protein ACK5AB_09955, partial [Bacteroidota bacterium]